MENKDALYHQKLGRDDAKAHFFSHNRVKKRAKKIPRSTMRGGERVKYLPA